MMARMLSWLGGPVARTLGVLLGAAGLVAGGHRRQALVLILAVGGAGGLNTATKKAVGRHRPISASAGGESFPSGHTSGTLALTGIGAYLVWRSTGDRVLALVIAVAGIPLTGLIGLSRLVLHEHYPGDVLGGYVLALAWLGVTMKLAARFLGSGRSAQ
jgi:undecaprenyl-diphosphatase